MLLSLPTELVELILRTCDTTTYLQLAFSCRTLLSIATNGRELITHHLKNTPGCLNDDYLGSASNRQLFRLLVHLSYHQLYGAEFYSERKLFNFPNKVLDTRASSLRFGSLDNVALVFKNDETTYRCRITQEWSERIRLNFPLKSPASKLGKREILFTAHGGNERADGENFYGTYVLHRFKPFIDQSDTDHPFIQQAMQSSPDGNIFLAFHADRPSRDVYIYSFPDEQEYEPVALAAAPSRDIGFKFAISWQHRHHHNDHHVMLYANADDDEDDDDLEQDETIQMKGSRYDSCVLTESIETAAETSGQGFSHEEIERRGPAMKLAFKDEWSQLLHYHRGQTLYSSFQKVRSLPSMGASEQPKLANNACRVKFSDSLSLQFAIDLPFFSKHEPGDELPGGRCHWQYLAVGIATHRVEHWTVACLLKSEAFSGRCDHERNLDRGRRFDQWEIMARLDGYHESNTSHRSLITASFRGTRIAAASWKTVTIWALNPDALVERNESGFYPESWKSSTIGVTELPPIVIDLGAVCSQIEFTVDENELIAITDRGLMVLTLKPDGRGVEVVENCKGIFNSDGIPEHGPIKVLNYSESEEEEEEEEEE
ncbi:hypothetical protein N7481_000555 [Penicillium waksmanii]|uniref:uncharacterized protein n=1 Tax=Penicillium waksmanii TaxID=69791 RepID=UPI00254957EE|nr:uncharacterized protein N7481_000555 [Penicillium waksmanii]KAJ6000146.1 hypothetical protein N7481_000555 [Penicillium waksmanii]